MIPPTTKNPRYLPSSSYCQNPLYRNWKKGWILTNKNAKAAPSHLQHMYSCLILHSRQKFGHLLCTIREGTNLFSKYTQELGQNILFRLQILMNSQLSLLPTNRFSETSVRYIQMPPRIGNKASGSVIGDIWLSN